jgi:DNA-binding MarR family transcriptional regulator
MNELSRDNSRDISTSQMNRFQWLINEVQRCCEDKRLYESHRLGIPYAEIKCLMLFENERYLTVKGIAERLDVAKSRVTKLVNSVFDKGLIDRTDDPNDARIKLLRLTPEGKKVVASIKEFQQDLLGKILSRLDSEERGKVITGLELLRSAMEMVKESLGKQQT